MTNPKPMGNSTHIVSYEIEEPLEEEKQRKELKKAEEEYYEKEFF